MKRILCYGDSNTWGFIPGTSNGRYQKRYPVLIKEYLGNDYQVIEEGLRGRTAGTDNIKEFKGNRNGQLFFGQAIYSHDPLDYVVIMLGSNDLKDEFNKSAHEIANSIKYYIDLVNGEFRNELIKIPKIIIVAPSEANGCFFDNFSRASEISKDFNKEYKKIAAENNCYFVSNEGLSVGSDGLHLLEESHNIIASNIVEIIKNDN